jgi:hypothetical protein
MSSRAAELAGGLEPHTLALLCWSLAQLQQPLPAQLLQALAAAAPRLSPRQLCQAVSACAALNIQVGRCRGGGGCRGGGAGLWLLLLARALPAAARLLHPQPLPCPAAVPCPMRQPPATRRLLTLPPAPAFRPPGLRSHGRAGSRAGGQGPAGEPARARGEPQGSGQLLPRVPAAGGPGRRCGPALVKRHGSDGWWVAAGPAGPPCRGAAEGNAPACEAYLCWAAACALQPCECRGGECAAPAAAACQLCASRPWA